VTSGRERVPVRSTALPRRTTPSTRDTTHVTSRAHPAVVPPPSPSRARDDDRASANAPPIRHASRRSVGHSSARSIDRSVGRSVDRSTFFDRSVDRSVNFFRSIGRSGDDSARSLDRTTSVPGSHYIGPYSVLHRSLCTTSVPGMLTYLMCNLPINKRRVSFPPRHRRENETHPRSTPLFSIDRSIGRSTFFDRSIGVDRSIHPVSNPAPRRDGRRGDARAFVALVRARRRAFVGFRFHHVVCDQWDDADDGGGDAARDRVRTIVDRESDRGATKAKATKARARGVR